VKDVVTKVTVGKAVEPGEHIDPAWNCDALWDTGASMSFIGPDLVSLMDLQQAGLVDTTDFDGKVERFPAYYIALVAKGSFGFSRIRVGFQPKKHPYDLVIGMDVIQIGDFCLDNSSGKTKLTFKYPWAAKSKEKS
jgi:hypothetical protein